MDLFSEVLLGGGGGLGCWKLLFEKLTCWVKSTRHKKWVIERCHSIQLSKQSVYKQSVYQNDPLSFYTIDCFLHIFELALSWAGANFKFELSTWAGGPGWIGDKTKLAIILHLKIPVTNHHVKTTCTLRHLEPIRQNEINVSICLCYVSTGHPQINNNSIKAQGLFKDCIQSLLISKFPEGYPHIGSTHI